MKSKYFIYYFFFTLVLKMVVGQYPDTILSTPILVNFFQDSGWISFLVFFLFLYKESKEKNKQ